MNAPSLIRKTIILLACMLALVIGIGYTLPGTFHVERTLVVDKAPAVVFPMINDLTNWRRWDPWSQDDPHLRRELNGGPGVGQTQDWASQASGTGSIKIIESQKDRFVKLQLTTRSTSHPRFLSFTLKDLGGKTKLTWAIDGENSLKPIGNYFGLGMNRYLGPMYEQGLSNLKSLIETGKLPDLVEAKRKRHAEKIDEQKRKMNRSR